MIDDGCNSLGCKATQSEINYDRQRYNAQNCKSGAGGGCPNYAGAIVFTGVVLITAGVVAEVVETLLPRAVSAASAACADGDCTNELVYGVGTKEHILEHTAENLDKQLHGVFTVSKQEVFQLIDQAWIEVQNISPNVMGLEVSERAATAYLVEMGKTIGYVGGYMGAEMGNPVTTMLQLVLKGTSVITAYPALP